ncbi:thioesterase II family protein (plasmid) [Streptomyces sp. CA-294286]|uniref:thioesterase II family protein n=1 Tax=Streptomyces sp. CA-294286 TaxID=3240070 RepID=UPI003D949489
MPAQLVTQVTCHARGTGEPGRRSPRPPGGRRTARRTARRFGAPHTIGSRPTGPDRTLVEPGGSVSHSAKTETRAGLGRSLLLPLGRRAGDIRTVVFPPLGGGLLPCLGLVAHLSRHGPVYGIRALGLEEGEEPDTRIPDMADRYAEAVAALPTRPDLFVGWSLGGLLAFETARRLTGVLPPDLVLIDSSPAPVGRNPAAYAAVRQQVLTEAAAHMDTDALARMERTVDAHLEARTRYRAEGRHPGRTLLITCTGSDDPQQARRWSPHLADVFVHSLDTGHFGVLRAPHLQQLSSHIQQFTGTLGGGRARHLSTGAERYRADAAPLR